MDTDTDATLRKELVEIMIMEERKEVTPDTAMTLRAEAYERFQQRRVDSIMNGERVTV